MTTMSTKQAWARGGYIFAATLLVLVGVFHILMGIAAIIKDQFFVVNNINNYVYEFDTTAWGWVHLILGIVATLAGFALFTGATWARVTGIILASLSAIANFFWLPYYPFWALLIIAIDIFAIWAMAAARPVGWEATSPEAMAAAGYRGEMMQGGERWPQANVPAGAGAGGGRHWAENVKEGAGQQRESAAEAQRRADYLAAQERAEAASRGGYQQGGQGGTMPGNPPGGSSGPSAS